MKRMRRSVLFALLGPAARLRALADVPTKELEEWVRLANFRALRDDGKTIPEAAEKLGVSVPTASRIAKKLRSDFLTPDEEYALPKRLLFALQERPLSEARFKQLFAETDEREIDRALAKLVEEGRIELRNGRTPQYHVTKREERMVGPDAPSRIGALESLLRSLSDLVRVRFFEERDAGFARTLTFRVHPEHEARLRELYEQTIWPALRDLDAEAEGCDDAQPIQFTVFWTPQDSTKGNEDITKLVPRLRKERSGKAEVK